MPRKQARGFQFSSGRGAARAEDAHGTHTQSHISPSILVYEDNSILYEAGAHALPTRREKPYGRFGRNLGYGRNGYGRLWKESFQGYGRSPYDFCSSLKRLQSAFSNPWRGIRSTPTSFNPRRSMRSTVKSAPPPRRFVRTVWALLTPPHRLLPTSGDGHPKIRRGSPPEACTMIPTAPGISGMMRFRMGEVALY